MSAPQNKTQRDPFAVNLWGSHPDDDNDDHWCGLDFDTLAQARAAFDDLDTVTDDGFLRTLAERSAVFVELGRRIGEHRWATIAVRRLRPDAPPTDNSDWRREIAIEAGMLHGVDAYNEVLGWD